MRGFSLVEILLSIFLLSIGIATTAYMIPVASRGLGQSKLTTQAAFYAQERLEEALSQNNPPQNLVDPDVPDLTGEIQRLPFNGFTRVKVTVYRTGDPRRHPLVELECMT